MRRSIAILSLLGLAACAGSFAPRPLPSPGCDLAPRAAVTLDNARNFMLAPVHLDGHAVTMLVDTGAETTTVSRAAAARLGLATDPERRSVLHGVGGMVRSQNVLARTIAIGGEVVGRDLSLGVGDLPAFPGVDPPVVGLLGADMLSGFDVELDLPRRRMVLYGARGCAGLVPWRDAVSVPMLRAPGGLAFVVGVVNDRTVRALVDTGARTTLVKRETARRAGLSDRALATDAARTGVGIGLASIAFHRHRFAQLGVPGDLETEVVANVADLDLPDVDMLLGADFLGARQVWISYGSGRLFLRR